jgi:hypothetical protein
MKYFQKEFFQLFLLNKIWGFQELLKYKFGGFAMYDSSIIDMAEF